MKHHWQRYDGPLWCRGARTTATHGSPHGCRGYFDSFSWLLFGKMWWNFVLGTLMPKPPRRALSISFFLLACFVFVFACCSFLHDNVCLPICSGSSPSVPRQAPIPYWLAPSTTRAARWIGLCCCPLDCRTALIAYTPSSPHQNSTRTARTHSRASQTCCMDSTSS